MFFPVSNRGHMVRFGQLGGGMADRTAAEQGLVGVGVIDRPVGVLDGGRT